jgi:alkanesulfonate monooxygenase SsuD/methylene tetrahydromethanopterin reductase-like flavin-dependent oxidoreductase (luciferase family)
VRIAIGLPSRVAGSSEAVVAWAVRADAGPFSSVVVTDRVVSAALEPLATLAVAGGATRRVRLMTSVVIGPTRETTLLARQAATIDALTGGRLTLGLGIGVREDDYLATGFAFRRRGRRLDEQLPILRRLWAGERLNERVGAIGPRGLWGGDAGTRGRGDEVTGRQAGGGPPPAPLVLSPSTGSGRALSKDRRPPGTEGRGAQEAPPETAGQGAEETGPPVGWAAASGLGPARAMGPELLLGGYVDAVARRIAAWADGFMAPGGGEPERMLELWGLINRAWDEAGRQGRPRWVGASYYALGTEAEEQASTYIQASYGYNPELAARRRRTLPTTPDAVREALARQVEMGVDEFILRPCAAELEQMQRLADVVG